MKKARSPRCTSGDDDDAAHWLFNCDFFDRDREHLELQLIVSWALEADDLVPKMLEGIQEWRAVEEFFGVVMSTEETLERARRTEAQ